MNNDEIKKILNDLYALDPALRKNEQELITIIRTMAIKPEAHYDPAFAANLRAQLLAELAHSRANAASRNLLSGILPGNSLRYAMLGVAVLAIGVVAFTTLQPRTNGPVAINASKVTITDVGANAFGTLTSLNGGSDTQAKSENAPTAAPAPMAAPMIASAPSQSAMVRPAMPVYISTVEYVYAGDPISQDQAQMDVLRKVTEPLSANQATVALEQSGLGTIDLSSFGGLNMTTVTLSEDKSFGYQISLDLANGTISIYQNYDKWPQGETTPLTASQIPSDSAVIATANQFLSDHHISTANYGAPEVTHNNNFIVPMKATSVGVATPNSAPAAMPMIPYYSDSEQVRYPLLVNGKNVYDTGGNKIGLTAEVNVRYNRVANVYGLETESYQSSAYDAITDSAKIISMAENTQAYPIYYNYMDSATGSGGGSTGSTGTGVANGGTTTNITTYKLGTPTLAYVAMYQSDSNGQSSEFLVPSYIFPVLDSASNTPGRNIVVPLIKAFDTQQGGTVVPPRPMPMNGVAPEGTVSSPTTGSPTK